MVTSLSPALALAGRAAIVTGGSQGIGYGVAAALVTAGADVVVTGRSSGKLEQARSALAELRSEARVVAVAADGSAPQAAAIVVDRTIAEFGRLDVVVNNAQQAVLDTPVDAATTEDIEVTFRSGFMATWRYMTAALPHLRATRGTIVNVGSGAGIAGMEGHGVYAANEEAIRGLSRVAAREWGPSGVTVNVIVPVVRTPQIDALPLDDQERMEQVVSTFPLRRFGDAEQDVGGLVVFLASEAGSFMTGATVDVTGGAFMRP